MPAGTNTSAGTRCSSPGLAPVGAELEREVALGRVHIGHGETRALGRESDGEAAADLAETGDRDAAAGDIGGAGDALERRAQGLVHAEARGAGGFARAADGIGQPDDVLGALADDEHVVGRRADVFGGAVQAVQRLDGVAEVEERRAAPLGVERRCPAAAR